MPQHTERLIHQHYGLVLAQLQRRFHSIDLVEDAVQEACIKALKLWPKEGYPNYPKAWLVKVAGNYLIDHLRREKRKDSSDQQELEKLECLRLSSAESNDIWCDDDLLAMIFTSCHPALSQEQQIALTLKLVMGFSLGDISQAFLIPERTLEQRITRAKRKIKATGIEWEIPTRERLVHRLKSVQRTLYLIFNEGYQSRCGVVLVDECLCDQAIGLTRSLCRLVRNQTESLGLLALMLFQQSRATSRMNEKEELVTLEHQDRSLWNKVMIAEADTLIQKALRVGDLGPFQIQASINGVHALAKTSDQTDWEQICLLYQRLLTYWPTPVVRLNYAVSILMLGNTPCGLDILLPLSEDLQHYGPYFAAMAKAYTQLGELALAEQYLQSAINLTQFPQERIFFQKQIEQLFQ